MRIAILLLFIPSCLFGQTGPAGVGSSANNPLWLKGDAGTSTITNGALLSSWNDQSGNSNNTAQATSVKQPLFQSSVINGMPAILFDNASGATVNDELSAIDNDNLDNTAGLTIFTVSRPVNLDNSSARAIISKRVDVGNNESYLMFYYTSNLINVDVDNNNDRFTTASSFSNNTNYIIDLLYDGTLAAASRSKIYINENLDVTKTETSASIPNNASPLTIGSLNVGDGRPFGGYIAEVIIFTKALNVAERIVVDNYLSSKYNITLTANDMYAGDTPANGDYDFEVAGVGTDASGSNSTTSSSVCGGIGIAQFSGFQAGDYMVYGHTSAQNNTISTDVGGMTGTDNARWSRIWYVDITNVGAAERVTITFDMSDGGSSITPVTASNYVLLYRAAQAGTWTELSTASSITGDQIKFNSVTISNDGYYTLGTRNNTASPLPIELIQFTGTEIEKGVELEWSTASEMNNSFFTMEKSKDGEQFEKLIDVKGAGTSATIKHYTAIDNSPFAIRSYYKLIQTDFDGTASDLGIISVSTNDIKSNFKLYPNPATSVVYIELQGEWSLPTLKIYNSQGKPIAFAYTLASSVFTIDTRSFLKGMYIVEISDGANPQFSKLLIE